jgi:HEAT repeat protein
MDDVLNIEPTSQNENLSASINIENIESGRDLATSFKKAKNAGKQVELFFAVAENKPEVAVPAFAEILETKASPSMRALALQGLGRIRDPHIKQALAACDTEEDLQVLRDVANEVKGKGEVSSDLTRWAAAWAIENIGFPWDAIEHLQGGALTDPPYRIRNEIINRKLQEISRLQILDSRNVSTPEYERNLEFWLYGPTEELFREQSTSVQYQTLVGDVIYCLNVRGIELAIDKDRSFLQIDDDQKRHWLQEQALGFARRNFCNFTEFEEKRAYETIGHFLSNDFNDDILLRNWAAQAIKQAGSWLDPSIRARSFVICEEWPQVAAIGEPAVSHLEEVIERNLRLAASEDEIINQQIKAVEAINQIQFAEFSEKIKKLVKVLLCPKEQVRKAAARLLKPYKEVDPNIANLVEALLFEYSLDKPELKDLTVPQMDERLSSCRETESFIATTFANAIAEANSLARTYSKSASTVQKVLQSKQEAYLSDIRGWITQIKKQISATSRYQDQIKYYQESLKDALYEIRGIDSKLYEELMAVLKQAALNSTEYQTYNQCQNLSPDLEYIKSKFMLEIDKYQAKLNQESKNRFKFGLSEIVTGVGIIIMYVISVISN